MNDAQNDSTRYVAYPRAAKILADRLGATPEEIAAWIWMYTGPDSGVQGLEAFTNANELSPPPRFRFAGHMGSDYHAALMMCWFREEDLMTYEPPLRFIDGKALIDRWARISGIHPEGFIDAKIRESRLLGIHPTLDASIDDRSDPEYVPIESRLFVLAEIEQVEAEDFGAGVVDDALAPGGTTNPTHRSENAADPSEESAPGADVMTVEPKPAEALAGPLQPPVGTPAWRKQIATKAANARHSRPGGTRWKRDQVLAAWASGKFQSKQQCAVAMAAQLRMSPSTAIRHLKGAPKPGHCSAAA